MTKPQYGILLLMEFRGLPVAESDLVETARLVSSNPPRAIDMLVSYGYLRRGESGSISITLKGVEMARAHRGAC